MVDLKGGEPRAAYRFYARMLVSRMKYLELPSNTVLLPCPSTRRKDHAKALAIELSQILGVPVVQALMTEKSHKSQKQKSRSEREKIVFQKTASLRRKHVIFIDDIVTTGATAKAAKKALGLTEGFEVWCLAHRRQLATDLGF